MRVLSRFVVVLVLVTAVVAALSAGPVPAGAQCSMMGGGSGGHDHGAMQGSQSTKPSGSDKKIQQNIDKLMSDARGRDLLIEAILNDRAFMESLLQQLAGMPGSKELGLQQPAAPDSASSKLSETRVAPGSPAAVYTCPMHPDVTSSRAGDCPKCGMALVRRGS